MAIDFPNSPTIGQIFTSGDNKWEWDGTSWNVVPTELPAGATGPTGPTGATGPIGATGATAPTIGWDEVIVKKVSETTTSNTLQDDDELFFNASSNRTYYVELNLYSLGIGSSAFSVPSGSSFDAVTKTVMIPGGGDNPLQRGDMQTYYLDFYDLTATDSNGFGFDSEQVIITHINGFLETNSNAGNVKFRYHENDGLFNNVTVYYGSNLKYKDIT